MDASYDFAYIAYTANPVFTKPSSAYGIAFDGLRRGFLEFGGVLTDCAIFGFIPFAIGIFWIYMVDGAMLWFGGDMGKTTIFAEISPFAVKGGICDEKNQFCITGRRNPAMSA